MGGWVDIVDERGKYLATGKYAAIKNDGSVDPSPDSDSNGDGVVTIDEEEKAKKKDEFARAMLHAATAYKDIREGYKLYLHEEVRKWGGMKSAGVVGHLAPLTVKNYQGKLVVEWNGKKYEIKSTSKPVSASPASAASTAVLPAPSASVNLSKKGDRKKNFETFIATAQSLIDMGEAGEKPGFWNQILGYNTAATPKIPQIFTQDEIQEFVKTHKKFPLPSIPESLRPKDLGNPQQAEIDKIIESIHAIFKQMMVEIRRVWKDVRKSKEEGLPEDFDKLHKFIMDANNPAHNQGIRVDDVVIPGADHDALTLNYSEIRYIADKMDWKTAEGKPDEEKAYAYAAAYVAAVEFYQSIKEVK